MLCAHRVVINQLYLKGFRDKVPFLALNPMLMLSELACFLSGKQSKNLGRVKHAYIASLGRFHKLELISIDSGAIGY